MWLTSYGTGEDLDVVMQAMKKGPGYTRAFYDVNLDLFIMMIRTDAISVWYATGQQKAEKDQDMTPYAWISSAYGSFMLPMPLIFSLETYQTSGMHLETNVYGINGLYKLCLFLCTENVIYVCRVQKCQCTCGSVSS